MLKKFVKMLGVNFKFQKNPELHHTLRKLRRSVATPLCNRLPCCSLVSVVSVEAQLILSSKAEAVEAAEAASEASFSEAFKAVSEAAFSAAMMASNRSLPLIEATK